MKDIWNVLCIVHTFAQIFTLEHWWLLDYVKANSIHSLPYCSKFLLIALWMYLSILHVCLIRLNAVREMCVRCPLVMTSDLLQDLASYKSYRDKSVMMAARSLIHLYRDANPELLKRKDRVSVLG